MSRHPSRTAAPPVPAPCRPADAFAPGDHVLIVDGLSKGITAIVVERWSDIGGLPAWRLDLPDCRDRVIREDFLERVAP